MIYDVSPSVFFVGVAEPGICVHLAHPDLHLLIQHQIHAEDFLTKEVCLSLSVSLSLSISVAGLTSETRATAEKRKNSKSA